MLKGAGRSSEAPESSKRIRTGGTTCCFTSTSTATTARESEPATPAGQAWWPTSLMNGGDNRACARRTQIGGAEYAIVRDHKTKPNGFAAGRPFAKRTQLQGRDRADADRLVRSDYRGRK